MLSKISIINNAKKVSKKNIQSLLKKKTYFSQLIFNNFFQFIKIFTLLFV